MNTQRQANDFDFSKKLVQESVVNDRKYSRAITNATSKIGNFINKSFKNTVVQGLLVAFIVIVLGLAAISPFVKENYKNKQAQIEKIASISPQEFEKMMIFVKGQLQVGEQVAARGLYAGDYIMKNLKMYNIDYIADKKTDVIKYQREHEKFVHSRIVLLSDVYYKANKKDVNNIDSTDVKRFFVWFNSYKNGEKHIDENLRDTVDKLVATTDITDEINKKYPDPLKSN